MNRTELERAQNTALNSNTRCALCGMQWTRADTRIMMADTRARELVHLLQDLSKHLIEKHPEHMQQLSVTSGEFAGFLLMAHFVTDDQQLRDQLAEYRKKLSLIVNNRGQVET